MPEAASTGVDVRRTGGIVTIVLRNPARRNAIDDRMQGELLAALEEVRRRAADDRVVVLTGAGEDFSSGADLVDPVAPGSHPVERMDRFAALCLAVRELPQPVVARVAGVAYGGGMNLALSADLVLASDDARLCQVFARRGMVVDCGGSWLLPRLVGPHRAKELVLLADELSGRDAAALGIVNRSVPGGQLDELVERWAARLARGAPLALRLNKQLLNAGSESGFGAALRAEGLAQAVAIPGPEVAEALAALEERREPEFGP